MPSGHIISNKKLAANRRNATRSTGPRTDAGKNKSRLNGVSHGLAGNTILTPWENPAEYDVFVAEVLIELDPQTDPEIALATAVAGDRWRLRRHRLIEDGLFHQPGGEEEPCPNQAQTFLTNHRQILLLSIYRQRIGRSLHSHLAELKKLQNERRAARQRDLEEATERFELSKMRNLPFDATIDGFGYSNAEIAAYSDRKRRLWRARALFRPDALPDIPSR